MTIAATLAEIESSPGLLDHFDHLEQIIRDEQRRREQFTNDINDSTKAEFINGQAVIHSLARFGHLQVSRCISALFHEHVLRHDLGEIFIEKCFVRCRRNDYEPDVCFFSRAKCTGWDSNKMIFPPPDLIVEILSPSTERNDRTIKLQDYAQHGVSEYWIVDADACSVEQHLLPSGASEYRLNARLSGKELLTSPTLVGFEVSVSAFFDTRENQKLLRALWGKS